MGLKIKNEAENDIRVSELEPGQLAVITKWGSHTKYVGALVTLIKEPRQEVIYNLVSIDGGCYTWCNWNTLSIDCRVRVLPPGTELVVE